MTNRAQEGLSQLGGEQGPRQAGQDVQQASRGLRLATEQTLNMQKFPGEQDRANRVHYTKWAGQIKDYIEPKGPEGIELVNARTTRAQSRGRKTKVADYYYYYYYFHCIIGYIATSTVSSSTIG